MYYEDESLQHSMGDINPTGVLTMYTIYYT